MFQWGHTDTARFKTRDFKAGARKIKAAMDRHEENIQREGEKIRREKMAQTGVPPNFTRDWSSNEKNVIDWSITTMKWCRVNQWWKELPADDTVPVDDRFVWHLEDAALLYEDWDADEDHETLPAIEFKISRSSGDWPFKMRQRKDGGRSATYELYSDDDGDVIGLSYGQAKWLRNVFGLRCRELIYITITIEEEEEDGSQRDLECAGSSLERSEEPVAGTGDPSFTAELVDGAGRWVFVPGGCGVALFDYTHMEVVFGKARLEARAELIVENNGGL